MNMLAFDITQFFPLLNYHLLSLILNKVGFDPKVLLFFKNYLIERKTKYLQNKFSSPFYSVDIGVGQSSVLLPISSALYLFSVLHILEKHLLNLKIPIFILSFIDNGLLISQNKFIQVSNANLFCSYNVTSSFFSKFDLVVKHGKSKVFHFSRSYKIFNSSLLNLTPLGGPVLHPKNTWRYFGFFFNQKLSFHQHIDIYANKAILMVKCIKMLGNLTRGLNLLQKRFLYRSCVLPITFYGFQLWYYNNMPLHYLLKSLGKIQQKAAL